MFYLGIDVSKNSAGHLIVEELGSKVKAFTFKNDKESLESLCERVESLSITADNLPIGIEATGSFLGNI